MKDKEPKLPAMVRAYLNAERLSEQMNIKDDRKIKFRNSLATLEHYMTPTERLQLRMIKGQIQ